MLTLLVLGAESLDQKSELLVREWQFRHIHSQSHLGRGDVAGSEFIEISQKLLNSNAFFNNENLGWG